MKTEFCAPHAWTDVVNAADVIELAAGIEIVDWPAQACRRPNRDDRTSRAADQ
jgi:hypothetical protein